MTFDCTTTRLVQAKHMIRSLPLAVLTRRHLTAPPRPDEVCRQASEHNTETDSAVQRILVHQAESYHTTGDDKEKRRERMARHAKNITIAITPSENKDARRRQRKENHIYRHNVIQNLFEAAGDKCYNDGQSALQRDRERRNSCAIKPCKLLEEQSIFGHREVNSGRRQHALTQESNCGNGNAGGEQTPALLTQRHPHHGRRWSLCLRQTFRPQGVNADIVHRKINHDHTQHAKKQTARQIFSRLAYLTGDEARGLPTTIRELRRNQSRAKSSQQLPGGLR